MIRIISAVAAAIVLFAPATAQALNYSYVELSFPYIDPDNNAPEGDGIELGFSKELGSRFYGFMHWADFGFKAGPSTGKFDLSIFDVGFGYHYGIGEKTDLLAELAFVTTDADGATAADDDGYLASVGVRSRVREKLEAELRGNFTEFGGTNDEFAGDLRLRWYFTPAFAVQAKGVFGEDANAYVLGFRIEFGNE